MASYVAEDGRQIDLAARITGFKIGDQFTVRCTLAENVWYVRLLCLCVCMPLATEPLF